MTDPMPHPHPPPVPDLGEVLDDPGPLPEDGFPETRPGIPHAEMLDLLESAWGVIANAGWDGSAKTEGWQEAAVRWRDKYHLMLGVTPVPAAASTPEPSGRLARIEVKGFRDLGVVRVTEVTFAGEPMVHAERTPWSSAAFEGDAADFPASSLHFVTWLPERLIADGGPQRAIGGRDFIGAGQDDDGLDQDDDPYERSY